jgi:hypothetical protein
MFDGYEPKLRTRESVLALVGRDSAYPRTPFGWTAPAEEADWNEKALDADSARRGIGRTSVVVVLLDVVAGCSTYCPWSDYRYSLRQ